MLSPVAAFARGAMPVKPATAGAASIIVSDKEGLPVLECNPPGIEQKRVCVRGGSCGV